MTDAGLQRLSGLKGLKYLNLTDTKITHAGLQQLGKMTGLETLKLDLTKITNAGLIHLAGSALKSLSLGQTSVSREGNEQCGNRCQNARCKRGRAVETIAKPANLFTPRNSGIVPPSSAACKHAG